MTTELQQLADELKKTKKCPFCAEEILAEAIKCRYCGEFLEHPSVNIKKKAPWYCSTTALIIAALTIGPLVIPMIWLNPKMKIPVKIVFTMGIIFLTLLAFYFVVQMYASMMKQFEVLGI